VASFWGIPREVTPFSARIHTTNISFQLAHWTGSAGLFVNGETRVNLALTSPCAIDTGAETPFSVSRPVTLRSVTLQSVDVSDGLGVAIDVQDGALLFSLNRREAARNEFASVLFDRESGIEGFSEIPNLARDGDARRLLILPADGEKSFSFGMRFLAEPKLRTENNIPLRDGGFVLFQLEGESGIVGSENWLESDKRYLVDDGLKLSALQNSKIKQLSVHLAESDKARPDHNPAVDWLDATIAGESKNILLISRGRSDQLARRNWSHIWPEHPVALMQAAGGLLTALVSVYNLVKSRTSLPRSKG
jgi:hypothetical protein